MDSEITSIIIDQFTRMKVPILSLHDSYIVQTGHEQLLKDAMTTAFNKVMGVSNVQFKQDKHPIGRYFAQVNEDAAAHSARVLPFTARSVSVIQEPVTIIGLPVPKGNRSRRYIHQLTAHRVRHFEPVRLPAFMLEPRQL